MICPIGSEKIGTKFAPSKMGKICSTISPRPQLILGAELMPAHVPIENPLGKNFSASAPLTVGDMGVKSCPLKIPFLDSPKILS